MHRGTRVLPMARKDKLLTQTVGDELVVYDEERHQAHHLNRSAALVWRYCDGHTSISDMAAILNIEAHLPADEDLVWLALARLEQTSLLRDPVTEVMEVVNLSRRRSLERLAATAAVALSLPMVKSIVVPTPAMAGSAGCEDACRSNFEACNSRCNGDDACLQVCVSSFTACRNNC